MKTYRIWFYCPHSASCRFIDIKAETITIFEISREYLETYFLSEVELNGVYKIELLDE